MLIRTPIDDIVEFIKEKKTRVSVVDLSKRFNISLKTLETWLVVLEYKKIVRVHYVAFQEFVEFNFDNQKHVKEFNSRQESLGGKREIGNVAQVQSMPSYAKEFVLNEKNNFISYCREKKIDDLKANFLWRNYVKRNLEYAKSLFYQYARSLNVEIEKIDLIWQKYLYNITA